MERKDVKALLPPPPQRDDDLEEPDKEDDQPHEDEPAVNPLVVAWANAGPEARRDFVRACWSEIMQARESGQGRQRQRRGPWGATLYGKCRGIGSLDRKRQPMTTQREGLLDKIRALLAKTVGSGCTESEALAALSKARAMMDAHEITEDELQLTKAEAAVLRSEPRDSLDPHNIKWHLMGRRRPLL